MNVTMIATDIIEPNDYNPNWMAAAGFAELVTEVRHLGRLPKPVVVRCRDDGRYTIIDGEHGWLAACEAGLQEIPAEIVAVDDFEARRQTFKRNQHGEHNPVLLGRMFLQMMRARSLSQRALAKEIEVSEGTIRNALSFAEAAALRNSYAPERDDKEVVREIAGLHVRQVRAYCALPEVIRDWWLRDGADLKLLESIETDVPAPGDTKLKIEVTVGDWERLVESGLTDNAAGFAFTYAREVWRIWSMAEGIKDKIQNVFAYVRPVVDLGLKGASEIFDRGLPLHRTTDGWTVSVSAEVWTAAINDAAGRLKAQTVDEFLSILKAATRLHLSREGRDHDFTDPRVMQAVAAVERGPDYIRDSDLVLADKIDLMNLTADAPADQLDTAKRETVKTIRARDAVLYGNTIKMLDADDQALLKDAWSGITVAEAFNRALAETRSASELKARNALFANRDALLDAVVKEAKRIYVIRETQLGNCPAHEVLRARLRALPWPEFRLLAAFILGHDLPAASLWIVAVAAETGERHSDPNHAGPRPASEAA